LIRIRGESSVFLGCSFLGCGVGAGCFVHTRRSLVFLAKFFNQTTGHEILKLLVSTQAEHFFSTADGIANFEVGEDTFKEIVEAEDLFFSKDIAKFIGDMVRKTAGESGTFRCNCHNDVNLPSFVTKATQKTGEDTKLRLIFCKY
jgi:hypothetical protein